jgi:hypothetical protein
MHYELASHGIQIATINPGPYGTGFNDRMVESRNRWYDPKRNFTRSEDLERLARHFERQFDPQELIQAMIELVEADSGPYRTVLPEESEEVVRNLQREAWTRRQSPPAPTPTRPGTRVHPTSQARRTTNGGATMATATRPQRKGLRSGVTNELSIFLKVLPGRAQAIREACKAADREPQRLASFQKLGILTEARWVLFDNDTRMAFSTVYEGSWDAYIEAFMPEVIPALDRILRGNIEGYPTKPINELTVDEVKAWLDAQQVTAAAFIWVHGDHTLKDIWKAERVEKAFEEVLDSPEGRKALTANPAFKPLLAEATH